MLGNVQIRKDEDVFFFLFYSVVVVVVVVIKSRLIAVVVGARGWRRGPRFGADNGVLDEDEATEAEAVAPSLVRSYGAS